MTREKIGHTHHKNPKFRESYDEEFDGEDLRENQRRRKKLNKKPKQRTIIKENG